VRQGLTGRARSGGDGGIFGGDNQGAALQKQGKPRPDAPFAVSDSPMFDRQQAKENYADQVFLRVPRISKMICKTTRVHAFLCVCFV